MVRVSQQQMNLKNFSYTEELQKAAKSSKWSDFITDPTPQATVMHEIKSPIMGNEFSLKHQLCHLLEFPKYLYYFFVSKEERSEKDPQFKLTIYSFKREDGQNTNVDVKDLKGTPSCISAGFITIDPRLNGEKDSRNEEAEKSRKYCVVALIGLKEGFIKVIEFNSKKEAKVKTYSQKLQHKSIVSILAADKKYYNQKNICFILFEDSKVFVYNYLSKQKICIFQPPILSHDFAVCMTLHISGNYLATCSKSGQIFFWELGKNALEAIEKSENLAKKKDDTRMDIQEIVQSSLQFKWQFGIKDRVVSVFPMYSLHSASIYGLKWISFFGNHLALVSRKGQFRIIAINFQLRDEYLNLIEYQIEKGESISSVQIFPQREVLVVTKCKNYLSLMEDDQSKGADVKLLKWKEKELKKNDYNSKMNLNSYRPMEQKESLMEIIRFDGELRVQNVERVKIVTGRKNNVNVDYSIISQDGSTVLSGNDSYFYIASCPGYFFANDAI